MKNNNLTFTIAGMLLCFATHTAHAVKHTFINNSGYKASIKINYLGHIKNFSCRPDSFELENNGIHRFNAKSCLISSIEYKIYIPGVNTPVSDRYRHQSTTLGHVTFVLKRMTSHPGYFFEIENHS